MSRPLAFLATLALLLLAVFVLAVRIDCRSRFDPNTPAAVIGEVVGKKQTRADGFGDLFLLEIQVAPGKTVWQTVTRNEFERWQLGEQYEGAP